MILPRDQLEAAIRPEWTVLEWRRCAMTGQQFLFAEWLGGIVRDADPITRAARISRWLSTFHAPCIRAIREDQAWALARALSYASRRGRPVILGLRQHSLLRKSELSWV